LLRPVVRRRGARLVRRVGIDDDGLPGPPSWRTIASAQSFDHSQ